MNASTLRAVYFDIGETILDRTREYSGWAHELGLPPHTFSAVFGAVVSAGGGIRDVLARLRPDSDPVALAALQSQLADSALIPPLADVDLYPGVRGALTELRALGLQVGIVGNQPARIGPQLRALGLDADVIAVSAEWGVRKPEPAFFARVVAQVGSRPDQVLYVGDQLENDVRAPLAAGLAVARVRTGPWGMLTRDDELEARCLAVLDSVADLPAMLR